MNDSPGPAKGTAAVYMMALLYAIIIGFAFMFTKLALRYADPFDMLAYRFVLSFGALAIPARLGWIRIPKPRKGSKRWPLLLISLIYPSAFFGFQSVGLDATTTSAAGIFSATTPIFALLLGALMLKERANWLQLLSVLVSAGGLVYMTGASADALRGTSAFGVTMMLLAAVALALYGVLARGLRTAFSAIELSYAMMRTGCVFFVGFALVRHAVQGTMYTLLAPLAETGIWLPLLYIAIMSSLVSSWMSNAVLARLEAFKVSLFVNLGNLISIASGVLLMGDHWSQAQTIGSICMLAGVIGANYRGSRQPGTVGSQRGAEPGTGVKLEVNTRHEENAKLEVNTRHEENAKLEENTRHEENAKLEEYGGLAPKEGSHIDAFFEAGVADETDAKAKSKASSVIDGRTKPEIEAHVLPEAGAGAELKAHAMPEAGARLEIKAHAMTEAEEGPAIVAFADECSASDSRLPIKLKSKVRKEVEVG